MITVVTDAGINAALQAGLNGPKISVTSVRVGSSIIQPTSDMTDVTNEVWRGDSSYIQYQIMDERTFLFKITLDESIGDFDIGNVGLFLEDGTMFSISTLVGPESKIKNNEPVVGNRKIFEIPIVISGLSGLINVNVIVPDESSIPFVNNEESLPAASLAPYSVYEITYSTLLKCPALALRTSTGWAYIPTQSADTSSSFDLNLFMEGIEPGDLVYFDPVAGKFKLADGLDDSKGYLGIRGSANNIVTQGVFINEEYNLVAGQNYYADGGSNAGKLTTTMNNYYVGYAINEKTLFLGVQSESVNNKTDTINPSDPSSNKYPSEEAVVNYVTSIRNEIAGNYALKDMSNVGDATFKGNITFNNLIRGTAQSAQWRADLAEYYEADAKYPKGTLVKFGGEKEITIADTENVNAVISSDPAIILNSAMEEVENATQIALIGRVPVRVLGKVKKFDKIAPSPYYAGLACVNNHTTKPLGIALEASDDEDEKMILCSVKLTF